MIDFSCNLVPHCSYFYIEQWDFTQQALLHFDLETLKITYISKQYLKFLFSWETTLLTVETTQDRSRQYIPNGEAAVNVLSLFPLGVLSSLALESSAELTGLLRVSISDCTSITALTAGTPLQGGIAAVQKGFSSFSYLIC